MPGSWKFRWGYFFSFSAAFSGTLTQRQMLGCFSPAWELDTPRPWRVSGFISLSFTSKTPPHHTWSCGDRHSRSVWYHQSWESLKYHQRFLGDCSERKALNTSKKSLSAGPGPKCIHFSHSHPANSPSSHWGRSRHNPARAELGSAPTTTLGLMRAPERPKFPGALHAFPPV